MTEAANLWLPTADRIEAMLKPLHEFLLPAADLHNGETVIDVGGGTGSTTAAAAWDALQAPLQTGRYRDRAQPLLNHEHPQHPGPAGRRRTRATPIPDRVHAGHGLFPLMVAGPGFEPGKAKPTVLQPVAPTQGSCR
jgi:hypothetical protein